MQLGLWGHLLCRLAAARRGPLPPPSPGSPFGKWDSCGGRTPPSSTAWPSPISRRSTPLLLSCRQATPAPCRLRCGRSLRDICPSVGGLLEPCSGPEGARGSPISLPPAVPRRGHGLERRSMQSHTGDARQGCSTRPRRGLPVAKPPPAALPPCLWKGPPRGNRTARSRCVCSPCFAPRGGLVFGGDARLCCRPDVPSGPRRVSVLP